MKWLTLVSPSRGGAVRGMGCHPTPEKLVQASCPRNNHHIATLLGSALIDAQICPPAFVKVHQRRDIQGAGSCRKLLSSWGGLSRGPPCPSHFTTNVCI